MHLLLSAASKESEVGTDRILYDDSPEGWGWFGCKIKSDHPALRSLKRRCNPEYELGWFGYDFGPNLGGRLSVWLYTDSEATASKLARQLPGFEIRDSDGRENLVCVQTRNGRDDFN